MSELFGIKKVGPNRYREDPGRYFEDFNVGDIYEHWPGRTITETDNIWFTNLTMNTHPVHFDANYASKTEFKRYLVNSAFTLSLVTGMCVSGTSQKAIANLGWEEIKLPAPVRCQQTQTSDASIGLCVSFSNLWADIPYPAFTLDTYTLFTRTINAVDLGLL